MRKQKSHFALMIPHHGLLWLGRVFALLVMLLVAAVSGGLWWLQQFHPQGRPLDISSWVPGIDRMLGEGINLKAGELEMFYDKGLVLRAGDLWLRGPDGTLAVVVEEAAVRFSRTALLSFKVAPRTIEAKNVTLRVVRGEHEISIAGLTVQGGEAAKKETPGVVGWLNGLALNDTWGWLENVRVAGLTLLLRDEVQHTEWIMQDANVDLSHGAGGGQHGSLVAEVRRITADGKERKLPVLVTFDHSDGAETAEIRARFGRADMDLVADYLPKQVSDMMQAEGSVEVGTTIDRANRLGQPWVTLRLRDIDFAPPPDFSHGLHFDRLTVTASYQPSPTDLLTLHDVAGTYKGMETVRAKGWVQGLAQPRAEGSRGPLASAVVYTSGGDAQRIFDFLADKKLDTAMPFLRENISGARFSNFVLTYHGHPYDMPFCGVRCGIALRGNMNRATVAFAEGMPPVAGVSGTFELRGETLYINAGPADMGPQKVGGVDVAINNLFTPGPTYVIVSGTAAGPLQPLLQGLQTWLKEPMPVVGAGTHSSGISVTVPFVRGKKTRPEDAVLAVNMRLKDVAVEKIEDLPLPPLTVSEGALNIGGGRLALSASARMGGQAVQANVADALKGFGANLRGQVKWPEATLDMNGDTITLTGKRLDLSAFDLFNTGDGAGPVRNMNVNARLGELITREAKLSDLTAALVSRGGHWEVNTFTAKVDGGNQVNIIATQGADRRRKLNVNVDNTGKLLRALGLYKDLRGGTMFGEINYDTPDVGSGVLQLRKFELLNPPVLVRLLGMLSLQQLLAGGDSTLFDAATLPLRLDGDFVYLDNVTLEGPSMSLRLNGSYNRTSKVMDIRGQMAPAIPFNRLVGEIPLLGTLLTGGQDGVVVADFSLKGSSAEPEISVQPLSVLTPGLLKGIFRGLTGGGNPAPKPKVIDGTSKP